MATITDTLLQLTQSSKPLPTYTQELWQTKAARNLKQMRNDVLANHALSPVEWAVLGLLYEAETGQKAQDLALALGVEAPFVTVILQKLSERKLVLRKTTKADRRVQLLQLSAAARKLVPKIEAELQTTTQTQLKLLENKDLANYFKVLKQLAELN